MKLFWTKKCMLLFLGHHSLIKSETQAAMIISINCERSHFYANLTFLSPMLVNIHFQK